MNEFLEHRLNINRRHFLGKLSVGLGSVALGSLLVPGLLNKKEDEIFSLAGIPLTAGFIAKFFILASGVQQNLWLPVLVLVITSVIGLYYYLRVISTLFTTSSSTGTIAKTLHPFFYISTYIALIVMMLLLCWLGIFPGRTVEGIREFLLIR